ncbi:GPI-anchor transamidase [Zancudomyces culisetae]|uniref:GPI-anchor transamidase n=1 Tax=Zancudomyces culisetae TaxID=1213189 RepID=A0A1R1PL94_ZANCU|nr:GPI-anchor transamidase [Zancudomyces culisetae]OMH81642.1 GPI-anchor transamidase [Zancudomyces culisetae]|eukprot:OMH79353.1 GPI-anchor transamidase [Zancudomyces culisetae]
MLADDMACNPRNQVPGAVFDHPNKVVDLYGDNIEVDYRGYEVTVENFIRLLTGRVTPETPRSKRLLTDDKSNILIFMTGHGGDEFLKFQDFNEISSYDIAYAFAQMWEKKRYNEILFMIDTCQANTMYKTFYSPNIIAMGSSNKGENSYSYHHDYELGVSVIDRFTYSNLNFFERVKPGSKLTLQDLVNSYDKDFIASTPGIRTDLFKRHLNETLLSEFFGAEQNLELTKNTVKVTPQNNQPRRNKVSLSTRLESYKGVVTRESNNHRLEVKHANFEYLNTVGSLMFMLFSYSIYSLFV